MIFIHAIQLLWRNDCNYPLAFVYLIGAHAVAFFFLVRYKMVRNVTFSKNFNRAQASIAFQRLDRAKSLNENREKKNDDKKSVCKDIIKQKSFVKSLLSSSFCVNANQFE